MTEPEREIFEVRAMPKLCDKCRDDILPHEEHTATFEVIDGQKVHKHYHLACVEG